MDYQKSIQTLLKEAKAGTSYYQLAKPYRVFLWIALFPLYVLEMSLIISYYVMLFLYNAMMSPVTYLESWQDKKKDGVFHATQAVIYFVSTPFIFLLRIVLSMMSFAFFFLWFYLMCTTYIVTLGGVKWQPFINVVPENVKEEKVLKASAGEKFAAVALVFFAISVIATIFVNSATNAVGILWGAYGLVVILVNAIMSSMAKVSLEEKSPEKEKEYDSPDFEVVAAKTGIFGNFVFASVMASILALTMFILAWITNGSNLFYGNKTYYSSMNGLPGTSLILLGVCLAMGLAKMISVFMGASEPLLKNGKTVLAVILMVVCAVAAIYGIIKYVDYSSEPIRDNQKRSAYVMDTEEVQALELSDAAEYTIEIA